MFLIEVALSKIRIEKVRVLLEKCVLIQGVIFTTAMVLNVDIFVDMNLVQFGTNIWCLESNFVGFCYL